MNTKLDKISIVTPYSYYGGECHYCYKSKDGRISYGMTAVQLTVEDYMDLLEIGWRRSGTHLYKPTLQKCCCQQIPIRLDVSKYKASKTQKRLKKKFNHFLETGQTKTTSNQELEQEEKEKEKTKTDKPVTEYNLFIEDLTKSIKLILLDIIMSNSYHQIFNNDNDTTLIEKYLDHIQIKSTPHSITKEIHNTNDNPIQLSFSLLVLKKNKQCTDSIIENISKEIINIYNRDSSNLSLHQGSSHHINIKEEVTSTIPSNIKPKSINNHKTTTTSTTTNNNNNASHKLEITMGTPVSNDEVYELYCKFQRIIHKDTENTKRGFIRFLVDSPLIRVDVDSKNNGILQTRKGVVSIPECGFGSFFQYYRLDGKLIAIGVVDILPYCLSSVYFFYDPDYSFLGLGNLSALYEIGWVQKHALTCDQLKYYYMGYYINNCQKMKYKGSYQPSDLLCQTTFKWVPLKDAVEKINKNDNKYTTLSDDTPNNLKSKAFTPDLVDNIKILINSTKVVTASLLKMNPTLLNVLKEYYDNTGDVLSKELLLKF